MLFTDYENHRSADGYFHFVYETTCLVNGKKYRGKRSTKNLDDGYIGSGTILKHAIRVHGRENFQRDILVFAPSCYEAYELEEKLIAEVIGRDDCYNIHPGGNGASASHVTSEQTRAKQSKIAKEQNRQPPDRRAPKGSLVVKDRVTGELIGRVFKTHEKYISGEWVALAYGRSPSSEAREKQKQTLVRNGTMKMPDTKGSLWWTNGVEQTRGKESPGEGWYRGRTTTNTGTKGSWWHNGVQEKKSLISPGSEWVAGRLPRLNKTNKKGMN